MQTDQTSNNAPASGPQPAFPAMTPGQKLAGCYVLRSEKYAGGATSIWVAQDEVLGRDVALHFLPQAVRADEKAMDELRQQIKRNRQLLHPNILRIYDFVEEKDWAAIATDAIEGECLAQMRAGKPGGFFEADDVKPWLAQLCQTLDEAHRIQLVHGDLSPEHLFIDAGGRVVAADFGIGRCIREALWRANPKAGATPPVENVSPQLLDGQVPCAVDDVYAAGVLMHELLAGAPPFTGPDVAEKIRNAAAPKVAERRAQLQKSGGPVAANLEAAVAACLEKLPAQRPKNLADVIARLDVATPVEEPVVETVKAETVKAEIPVEEPVIAVVKKAWGGAKKAAPAFASAGLPTAQPVESDKIEIPASEIQSPESGDLSDHETALKNAISENRRSLDSRRSSFPLTGLAAAAILVGVGVYAVTFGGFRKRQVSPEPATVAHAESATERPQYSAVKNPISEPVVEKNPVVEMEPVAVIETAPVPSAVPTPAAAEVSTFTPAPKIESAIVVAAAAKPAKPAATPIPEAAAGPSVASKTAALDAAKRSAEEWERAHQTMLKKKEQAEAAVVEARKALEEKMRLAGPMLKASEEVAALRQKREAEMRAAELAAEEARKAAEEKVRVADEAKRAVAAIERENKDKLAGQKKVEAELDEIKKAIADNERVAAESAKMADGAMAKRVEQAAAVRQKEQEVALAMAAAEVENQRKKEMEDKRSKIMKEMDDAKRLFEERMKALESSLKDPATPPPAKPPVEKPQAEVKPTPAPLVAPAPAPTPAPEPPKPVASGAPVLAAAESTLLAKMDTPTVSTSEPKSAHGESTPAPGGPTANSLGMAFIPVGDVQVAIWPTRLKDFETFAAATQLKSNLWRDPGFKQGADHPVVNVTWMEAMAFCKWLTFKEQRDGALPAGKIYRLPTDMEWSKAVGLPEETGKTAEARDMGVPDVYPWGNAWPPPEGAGNYTGEETGSDVAIKGYSDGFPWTSPVGSFPPNKYGLYDMGGNVWQWVMDPWNTDSTSKVLRGASWYNGALKLSLLSSCRVHAAQDSSTDNYGFRCVIASESQKSVRR